MNHTRLVTAAVLLLAGVALSDDITIEQAAMFYRDATGKTHKQMLDSIRAGEFVLVESRGIADISVWPTNIPTPTSGTVRPVAEAARLFYGGPASKHTRQVYEAGAWRFVSDVERNVAWTNSARYRKAVRLYSTTARLTNLLASVSFPGLTNGSFSIGDLIDFAEGGTLTANQETRVNRLVSQYLALGGFEEPVHASSPTNIPPDF